MIRLIDARKACKALESFRIKKDVFESALSDWEHGYNCGLERAEDEIQDFIVEAIPIEWLKKFRNGLDSLSECKLMEAIDTIIDAYKAERKEE